MLTHFLNSSFFTEGGGGGQYWRPPSLCWPDFPLDPSQSFLERSLQQNLRDLDRLSQSLMASTGLREQSGGHGPRPMMTAEQTKAAHSAESREQTSSNGTFTVQAESPVAPAPARSFHPNLSALRYHRFVIKNSTIAQVVRVPLRN